MGRRREGAVLIRDVKTNEDSPNAQHGGAGTDKDNGDKDVAGLTTVVQDGGNKTKNR